MTSWCRLSGTKWEARRPVGVAQWNQVGDQVTSWFRPSGTKWEAR